MTGGRHALASERQSALYRRCGAASVRPCALGACGAYQRWGRRYLEANPPPAIAMAV